MGSRSNKQYKVNYPSEKLKEQAKLIENEIIKCKDLFYRNIEIDYYGKNYVHTLTNVKEETVEKIDVEIIKHNIDSDHYQEKNEDKILEDDVETKNIIFIHGFMGMSLLFHETMAAILEENDNDKVKLKLYAIDLLGMAHSSRPEVSFKTVDEWIMFYVDFINIFAEKIKADKFYLVAHSMGAVFANYYTITFSEKVLGLTLLSPLGIIEEKNNELSNSLSDRMKSGLRWASFLWGFKFTLQSGYKVPYISGKISKGIKKRYRTTDEINDAFGRYTEVYLQYPKDCDEVIYYIFQKPLPRTARPVENILEEKILKKVSVDFFYGENDWMEKIGAERLMKNYENRTEDEQINYKRLSLNIITKGLHTFQIEQGVQLARKFVELALVVNEC